MKKLLKVSLITTALISNCVFASDLNRDTINRADSVGLNGKDSAYNQIKVDTIKENSKEQNNSKTQSNIEERKKEIVNETLDEFKKWMQNYKNKTNGIDSI